MEPSRFVFVDESAATIRLTPVMGRAPRNVRCVGSVPRNWGRSTTVIAALDHTGIAGSLLVEGAADRLVFNTFVEQVLAPRLEPGQIVVWDNLSVHKSTLARQAIEARGCELWFLPPYSPDFNPIEQAFSKLKAYLRRVEQRDREGLWAAIGDGVAQITADDANGWFRHCGYVSASQSL